MASLAQYKEGRQAEDDLLSKLQRRLDGSEPIASWWVSYIFFCYLLCLCNHRSTGLFLGLLFVYADVAQTPLNQQLTKFAYI